MLKSKIKIILVSLGAILVVAALVITTVAIMRNITANQSPNQSVKTPKDEADSTYSKAKDAQASGRIEEAISLYKDSQKQYEDAENLDGAENSKLRISILEDQKATDTALRLQNEATPKESLDYRQ